MILWAAVVAVADCICGTGTLGIDLLLLLV